VNDAVREKISYVKNRAYGVGSLDSQSQYLSMWTYGISQWNRFPTTKKLCLAEVVDSTPHPVHYYQSSRIWYCFVHDFNNSRTKPYCSTGWSHSPHSVD
jgi:hypothetical protein